MTRRKPMTAARRLRIFEAAGGICHICGARIDGTREPWEAEHVIPLAAGGSDDDANLHPAHVRCHAAKTTDDRKVIAKVARVRARHMGAQTPTRNPLPGSKSSRWKKRVDGSVVPRD